MALIAPDDRKLDARSAVRASLFLGATLRWDGGSSPARIRNLSANGALVEAAAIPAATAIVELVRGSFTIHASVAWSAGTRCGLKFHGSIDVERWQGNPTNDEQRRVDGVVRAVKAGAIFMAVPERGETAGRDEILDCLRRAADLLDSLGTTLAGDPDVVMHHGSPLQNLDISVQLIEAVCSILINAGDVASMTSNLSGLQRSAEQALARRML